MSDIKDILGVPRAGDAPDGKAKAAKPEKPKLVKPKGMSREAFALLSASHPLTASDLAGDLRQPIDIKSIKDKQKRTQRGQVTYQWQFFKNPARPDDLELEHWVKCYRDVAGRLTPASQGPYHFSKFNKKVTVYKYDDEEWEELVEKDPDWSREETDYLLNLCERFDFRWPVIADRYGEYGTFPAAAATAAAEGGGGGGMPKKKNRDIEDLKQRYYSVARQLLIGREGGPESVANNVIVKNPFNPAYERERKRGILILMSRSAEQDAEEGKILEQAQAIEQKRRVEAAARKAAAGEGLKGVPGAQPTSVAAANAPIQISDFWQLPPVGTHPLFDQQGEPAPLPDTAVGNAYPRSSHTRDLIQMYIESIQPAKNQKAVVGALEDLKMELLPRAASRAVCGAYLALIHEVAALLELKRKVATKQAALAAGGGGGSKRGRDDNNGDNGDEWGGKRARV